MCQYSAEEGNPTKWHYGHLQQLAFSGAGMVMMESTAVNDDGRITLKDLTIKDQKNEHTLKKVVSYIKNLNNIPLGIQISHAGRKGSSHIPWNKPNYPLSPHEKSWQTFSASEIKRAAHWPRPNTLAAIDILQLIDDYKKAAIKADNIGFDCLEIHMAHGYLLHQFFSPISNKRNDSYGGNLTNRARLLLEIVRDVRQVWPKGKIFGARITGKDWLKGGIMIEDAVWLARKLKDYGLDYICVSSGGIKPKTNLVLKPGYQVHLAREIKKKTGIITRTAGLIKNLSHASEIIESGSADLIAFGRKFVSEPTWLTNEIIQRNGKTPLPKQYIRCF